MTKRFFDPSQDVRDKITRHVGAFLPVRLFELLNEEALRNMTSRSAIIRQALADRYRRPGEEQRE